MLLENCAVAAGTTADEHATTLILRDAHAKGLLSSDLSSSRAPSARRSVIAPFSDEWALELAAYPTIGSC